MSDGDSMTDGGVMGDATIGGGAIGKGAIGDDGGAAATLAGPDSLRIDKWLWQARFFKTRGLASRVCAAGKLRVNGETVSKAHFLVRPGMVLTFPQGATVRVVRVRAMGTRRGPAPEARELYEDLAPPAPRDPEAKPADDPVSGQREAGAGRPTKAERRALDRLRGVD